MNPECLPAKSSPGSLPTLTIAVGYSDFLPQKKLPEISWLPKRRKPKISHHVIAYPIESPGSHESVTLWKRLKSPIFYH